MRSENGHVFGRCFIPFAEICARFLGKHFMLKSCLRNYRPQCSCGKVMFYTWQTPLLLDQRHTPAPHSNQRQTPPWTVQTPPSLSPSRPLLQRTVRIRLECILVQWWTQSCAVNENEKNGTEGVGFMLTMKLYI